MLGLLAILGYLAIVAGIQPDPHYGNNIAVPALLDKMFPPWFAGFGLASIAIGALVPGRDDGDLVGEPLRAERLARVSAAASPHEQTKVSKLASLVVKFGAVGFVIVAPTTYVVNFQLAAGVWILQTLPAVFVGVVWRKLPARAALAGWIVGTAYGTYLLAQNGFDSSSTSLGFGDHHTTVFIGIPALAANLIVVGAVTLALRLRGDAPSSSFASA